MLFLGTLTIAAEACASKPAESERDARRNGIEITADRVRYRAGQPLTLTVRNHRADTISFNPCTRALEIQRDGKWIALPEPERICTREAWMLSPDGTRVGPTELPARLAAGRYRIVLGFTTESGENPDGMLEARTPPFTVER